MKVPTLLTSLIPKKKQKTPLQKFMTAVTPQKKQLPVFKKRLMKKWRMSSIRKTIKSRGKTPMFSFRKKKAPRYLPAMLLQRMH